MVQEEGASGDDEHDKDAEEHRGGKVQVPDAENAIVERNRQEASKSAMIGWCASHGVLFGAKKV